MKIRETLEKMKRLPLGTHCIIYMLGILGGCFIGGIGTQIPGDGMNILILLGFILIFAGILWWLLFLKCPHCGRRLRLWTPIPNFCPECGNKLT